MRIQHHPLVSPSLGTQRHLHSFHFGSANSGQKAYLHASLHADELPGMLVLHHLKALLAAAEDAGELLGEVVIVPVANPIGLAQSLLHDQMGRFEFTSGENFNRRYTDLASLIKDDIEAALSTDDPQANKRAIRAAMQRAIASIQPVTELESLRHTLQSLAFDADVVLDLHCDAEAVLHIYSETPYQDQAQLLARCLGAQTLLLSQGSGGASFDEALSGVWWRLAEHFGDRYPIPLACLGATVELRGEADVSHALARADAAHLFEFLQHRGIVAGPAPDLPPLACKPTPLAGTEMLRARSAGVVVFARAVGDHIAAGDLVAEIIDPLNDQIERIVASVSGVLYARDNRRYATRGMVVAKIAGATAFRSGYLLTA